MAVAQANEPKRDEVIRRNLVDQNKNVCITPSELKLDIRAAFSEQESDE